MSADSLNFGLVAVGGTSELSFTVQDVGGGILSGTAVVSAPFSIVAGGAYSLGWNQSQVIIIRYSPTATGTNTSIVLLTGGGGASISVTGSAVGRPFPPINLRIVAAT